MAKEIAAGFVVYRRTKDGPKFLLLYDRGNDWNFPRGKLAEEEKSFEGAFRETKEETGLRRNDLKVKRGFKAYERFAFVRRGSKVHKTVIFYLAETNKKQVRLSDEHDGFGWFPYRDARRMLRAYRDRETVLKQANEFISRSARQTGSRRRPRRRRPRGRQPSRRH